MYFFKMPQILFLKEVGKEKERQRACRCGSRKNSISKSVGTRLAVGVQRAAEAASSLGGRRLHTQAGHGPLQELLYFISGVSAQRQDKSG